MATGEEKPLADFVAWCHKGPRAASVKNVVVSEEPLASYSSFEIRR
jgi:acylphosphatase